MEHVIHDAACKKRIQYLDLLRWETYLECCKNMNINDKIDCSTANELRPEKNAEKHIQKKTLSMSSKHNLTHTLKSNLIYIEMIIIKPLNINIHSWKKDD